MSIAGRLNRQIDIWGNVETGKTDELGSPASEDRVLASGVWAEIVPQTGSLMTGRQADTVLSKTTHKIIIRYSAFPALSNANWITHQGHRFDVDYVLNPYFKDEFLEVFCREVV